MEVTSALFIDISSNALSISKTSPTLRFIKGNSVIAKPSLLTVGFPEPIGMLLLSILISLLIDRQAKKIIKFNYNPVGVINLLNEKNRQKLIEINTILNNRMNEILNKFVDQNNLLTKKLQDEFKKEVIKLYQKNFGKKPLILITIIYNNSIVQQKKNEYENR